MPIKTIFERDLNILILEVDGALDMEMIYRHIPEVMASDEYSPNVNTLWDLRKLDFHSINKQFLEELIAFRQSDEYRKQRGSARLAYVATSDFEFGITRMYELLSVKVPQQMHIFRTMEEAKAWLTSE